MFVKVDHELRIPNSKYFTFTKPNNLASPALTCM